MHPGIVLIGLWLVWAVSWFIAARWASRPIRIESGRHAAIYRTAMVIGGLILAVPARSAWAIHLWRPDFVEAWLLVVLAFIGFAFAWWARLHLGTLWSSSVTIKPGHAIVDTGPYGLVRHPIYTGLLLAILATVIIKGGLLGIIGGGLILFGVILKARLEERVLREDLGPEGYDAYARRVPMLVPFLRIG